jgi:putative peptide zinc metalloprotease protein
MNGPPAFSAETILPFLRADISIAKAGRDISGGEGIVVHDSMRHRFFRLPLVAGEILQHWHLQKAGNVAELAGVDLDDVEELLKFLSGSRLLQLPAGGVTTLIQERAQGSHSLLMQGVHNYLFFRIPLLNPTKILDAGLPLARLLAHRITITIVIIFSVIGLFLTSRQWDRFVTTFMDFLTPEGFLLYGITLVFLKIAHELGHAFVARAYGAEVPVMGVAFMMLAPMLYTETSDAWRLPSRKARVSIDAAGLFVEFMLAGVALFLWSFLPDGSLRAAAFFVCTTAIIMSLLVNLSPFMRFDGYHILADAIGAYNLGPRSFALGRWKMREWIFGLKHAPPEIFSRRLAGSLIVFAWATWVYRLGLFLGIALLVYYLFPKVIGVPLFAIEIIYFIALPIYREIKDWLKMDRNAVVTSKTFWRSGIIFGSLIVLCFLPLDRNISVPAVLLPRYEAAVFSLEVGQVAEAFVRVGQSVSTGDKLVALTSPNLTHQLQANALRNEILTSRLNRISADARDLALSTILKQELVQLNDERSGILARQELLIIRATGAGVVTHVMDGLVPGIWVGADMELMHLAGKEGAILSGLANVSDTGRLENGAEARFVSEDGLQELVVAKLLAIGNPVTSGAEFTYLSSLNGGEVAMERDAKTGEPKPIHGVLPVHFSTELVAAPTLTVRGVATVSARPVSLVGLTLRRAAAIFLRESGF